MTTEISSYEDFFRIAFGNKPFDYQEQLAKENEDFPSLLNAPTGAGKTNAVLGAWLWRRLRNPESVGRRLIYCLPMRTLVEQTCDVVENALENLRKAKLVEPNDLSVHILYGGDVSDDWDIYPERQQIIIGTQDLLLSRALNRGYAMSRYKWTVPFGLLNNDCLWVIDEVQLLGSGLATTLQLQSFRRILKTFGKAQTIWMSATMESDWLKTADFDIELDAPCKPSGKPLGLSDKDFANEKLERRWTAIKNLKQAESKAGEIEKLVREIIVNHQANSMTLIIVNTVKRARELHKFLQEKRNGKETLLIHSRFRPFDRKRKINKLFDVKKTDGADAIVVTTQVVEAGVDVSAKTLFTELAPWASLVQRFGRCNREGEYPDGANVFWIDVPQSKKENLALPYDEIELTEARKAISSLQNVSPKLLDEYRKKLTLQERSNLFRYEHAHVIRQHDLHGLFSNERDLAGGFTDISHFVRNRERNPDVQVYWKYFKEIPSNKLPRPRHEELCAVRFYDLQKFLESKKGAAWEWNSEKGDDEKGGWDRRTDKDIRPGMTLLLSAGQGGYSEEYGWTGNPKDKPAPVGFDFDAEPNESLNDDQPSQTDWLALSAHLRDAEAEAKEIVQKLAEELGNDFLEIGQSVIKAAWWHDTGKTYPGWQKAVERFCNELSEKVEMYLNQNSEDERTDSVKDFLAEVKTLPVEKKPWAKFPDLKDLKKIVKKSSLAPKAKSEALNALNIQFRPNMRHEAASALTAWQEWQSEKEGWTALAVFLVACHHGKVRTVLRSTGKGEDVFGIKQADALPALPEWLETETKLNIEPRTIGVTGEWDGDVFKVAAPSWIGMIAELLGPELPDDPHPCDVIPLHEPRNLGVFRLAFLETLIRTADVKASQEPGKGGLNE